MTVQQAIRLHRGQAIRFVCPHSGTKTLGYVVERDEKTLHGILNDGRSFTIHFDESTAVRMLKCYSRV